MGCYGRAVPGPRCYGPRGHAGLLAAGIFASRAAAREVGSASIAKYFLFCPQVKFNNINLPPEAERWLQIAQSRPPTYVRAEVGWPGTPNGHDALKHLRRVDKRRRLVLRSLGKRVDLQAV